jgi:hypothetical protein
MKIYNEISNPIIKIKPNLPAKDNKKEIAPKDKTSVGQK